MKNQVLFFILSLLSVSLFSQKIVSSYEVKLKSVAEIYPVVNAQSNKFVIFLMNGKKIQVQVFDQNFNTKESHTIDRPKIPFSTLLGSAIQADIYSLVFINKARNQLHIKNIDVHTGESSAIITEKNPKKEKFIEAISYKNKFYLLSIQKASSILNLSIIGKNGIIEKHKLDLSSYSFSTNKFFNLYDVLKENSAFTGIEVYKFESNTPSPLALTSRKIKLFCYNDILFLTLDIETDRTRVIQIDLNDFSYSAGSYFQDPVTCTAALDAKSSSYLHENILYQVQNCFEGLAISISDISTDKCLKTYRVQRGKPISFKNSPLMKSGGVAVFKKRPDKTSKILNKLTTGDIGITVYRNGEFLELAIGSSKLVTKGIPLGPMLEATLQSASYTPGLPGTNPQALHHYNESWYGFEARQVMQSIYFKSLLAPSSFEHLEGKIGEDIFDEIDKAHEFSKRKNSIKTLFKFNNKYIYGYSYKKDLMFYLQLFEY